MGAAAWLVPMPTVCVWTSSRRLKRFGLDGGQTDVQVHRALRRGSAVFYSFSPALERSRRPHFLAPRAQFCYHAAAPMNTLRFLVLLMLLGVAALVWSAALYETSH